MRFPEEAANAEEAWPAIERALRAALADLIKMREREGKYLAKDLIHRLKAIRKRLKEVRALHPDAVKRYRAALLDRIQKAGLPIASDDERVLKEITFFADRADVSEELTRLESHIAQFAHHLRSKDPVGRTLEFITQEIFRELNTLGAKANDAAISQRVIACKAELEKIREQVQNLESTVHPPRNSLCRYCAFRRGQDHSGGSASSNSQPFLLCLLYHASAAHGGN